MTEGTSSSDLKTIDFGHVFIIPAKRAENNNPNQLLALISLVLHKLLHNLITGFLLSFKIQYKFTFS